MTEKWYEQKINVRDMEDWISAFISLCDAQMIRKCGVKSPIERRMYLSKHSVADTMDLYGDDILGYLDDENGEVKIKKGVGWLHLDTHFIDEALNLWANTVCDKYKAKWSDKLMESKNVGT